MVRWLGSPNFSVAATQAIGSLFAGNGSLWIHHVPKADGRGSTCIHDRSLPFGDPTRFEFYTDVRFSLVQIAGRNFLRRGLNLDRFSKNRTRERVSCSENIILTDSVCCKVESILMPIGHAARNAAEPEPSRVTPTNRNLFLSIIDNWYRCQKKPPIKKNESLSL